MIRHIALFRFASDTDTARVDALRHAVRALADVSAVSAVAGGPAVGWQDGWDFAMQVDVADRAAFDAYKSSPQHQILVEDFVRPMVTETARIQIDLD